MKLMLVIYISLEFNIISKYIIDKYAVLNVLIDGFQYNWYI